MSNYTISVNCILGASNSLNTSPDISSIIIGTTIKRWVIGSRTKPSYAQSIVSINRSQRGTDCNVAFTDANVGSGIDLYLGWQLHCGASPNHVEYVGTYVGHSVDCSVD